MKHLTAHELIKKARTVETELSKLQSKKWLVSPVESARATALKKERVWVKDQLDRVRRSRDSRRDSA